MLDFQVEWHDAPGVKDQVLAKTWARLEIQTQEEGTPPRWLTSCVRARSNSVQRGVYGSVFSLAEWIVEHWWFLLHEPLRVPEYSGGRAGAVDDPQRRWAQRHDLLAAREGGALPDLTFYRDGPDVVACWFPDPEQDEQIRPTRFISGAGTVRMAPHVLEIAIHDFVQSVLERLDQATDEDTQRLRANWQALLLSRDTEPDLCAWSAALGLDPYDPQELTDELVELLEHEVAAQPAPLRADLLEASSGKSLGLDLDWTKRASSKLMTVSDATVSQSRPQSRDGIASSAHRFGYQEARDFRNVFEIPDRALPDLLDVLHERCGWPADPEIVLDGCSNPSKLAMVGKDHEGYPRLVAKESRREASKRFRLARALYSLPSADATATLRLVTGAYTWDQRASRAFAAELLAPAAALRSSVGDHISTEQIDDLAYEYSVSSSVIAHQIANHRIGWIEAS